MIRSHRIGIVVSTRTTKRLQTRILPEMNHFKTGERTPSDDYLNEMESTEATVSTTCTSRYKMQLKSFL